MYWSSSEHMVVCMTTCIETDCGSAARVSPSLEREREREDRSLQNFTEHPYIRPILSSSKTVTAKSKDSFLYQINPKELNLGREGGWDQLWEIHCTISARLNFKKYYISNLQRGLHNFAHLQKTNTILLHYRRYQTSNQHPIQLLDYFMPFAKTMTAGNKQTVAKRNYSMNISSKNMQRWFKNF